MKMRLVELQWKRQKSMVRQFDLLIELDFYIEKQLENIVQLLYNGRKQIKGSDTHNITTKSKSIL